MFMLLIISWLANWGVSVVDPERSYPYQPDDFGISVYQKITLVTQDDYSLAGWWFPNSSPDRKNKTIIIAGGDAGNMSYSLYYVANLLQEGYSVLTFDYRGYGHSQDFAMDKTQLFYFEFVNDALAALDYARQQTPANGQVGFLSFSMGSWISTLVHERVPVDFIIAENYLLNPQEIINRLHLQGKTSIHLPENNPEYCPTIILNSLPVLLIAGKADKTTTLADAQHLKTKLGMNCTLIYHEGGHGTAVRVMQDTYFLHIASFLNAL